MIHMCVTCGKSFDDSAFVLILVGEGWVDYPVQSRICQKCAKSDPGVKEVRASVQHANSLEIRGDK